MAFTTRFLAFGCVHVPIHCEEFRQWRLEKIREHKPDVIINLGDWHDANYASRWDNEDDWDALAEFDALRQDAIDTQAAAPNAQIVWLHGNHCSNGMQPGRIPKKVRGAVEFAKNEKLRDVTQNWKIVPYGHHEFYRLGQITFQHGCQTNVNAERDQALGYGVPFGLHVSAHTHRPKRIAPIELPGRVPCFGMQYCNVGCGADWSRMHYMDRANKQLWGRAVLVGTVNAKQRRAWFGSRQWDGELLIHSMASSRAAI
jgi:hypothetical protein